jgi:hypothetical protein
LPPGLAGCPSGPRAAVWHNDIWSRCIDPDLVSSPASLDEIVGLVRDAEKSGRRIRAVGSGHSFSDIAVVDGYLVRMDRLKRVLPLDPATLQERHRAPGAPPLVSVEAGITVREINAALDTKRLALRNMGGWDAQTAAGVISTATHGSGLDYGSSSSFVRSLVMVTAGGRVLQIEPRDGLTDPAHRPPHAELVQDDDLFQAAVVSMGCMGIIYSAVIEVEPKYWLHEVRSLSTWEDITRDDGWLARLVRDGRPPPEPGGEAPRHYEIYVNPYATRGGKHSVVVVKRFYRDAPPGPGCPQRGQLWLLSFTKTAIDDPTLAPGIINRNPKGMGGLLDTGFDGLAGGLLPSDRCFDADSYRVFNAGAVNRLQAYGVELGVDLRDAIKAMNGLLHFAGARLAAGGGVNAGPISLRFVQESKAFLAPQFGHPTAMIEIQALVGVDAMDETLAAEEALLMRDFKARPHWGLDLSVIRREETLRELYPRYADWKAQFSRLNASGVFNSEFTDRVGLSRNDARPVRLREADACRR